jgi:hypothetical protein
VFIVFSLRFFLFVILDEVIEKVDDGIEDEVTSTDFFNSTAPNFEAATLEED